MIVRLGLTEFCRSEVRIFIRQFGNIETNGISVFEGGGRRDPVGKIVHARLSNKLERLECFFISMLMK
jgi:hypothetical protein